MVCRFSRVREKEIWQGYFLFCSDWVCFVFPVACCITSFSRGLVRLFFDWRVLPRGFVLLSFVRQSAEQCFDVCWFSAVTSRRIVVVLVTIWMFLLFLIDFYSIFCSYLQWIFRKKYVGLRVQNLCVVYWLRMQVLGKYLSPRMNFSCFSKILIPSVIGILVFTQYNILPTCCANITKNHIYGMVCYYGSV